jgi:hypothetical protein
LTEQRLNCTINIDYLIVKDLFLKMKSIILKFFSLSILGFLMSPVMAARSFFSAPIFIHNWFMLKQTCRPTEVGFGIGVELAITNVSANHPQKVSLVTVASNATCLGPTASSCSITPASPLTSINSRSGALAIDLAPGETKVTWLPLLFYPKVVGGYHMSLVFNFDFSISDQNNGDRGAITATAATNWEFVCSGMAATQQHPTDIATMSSRNGKYVFPLNGGRPF